MQCIGETPARGSGVASLAETPPLGSAVATPAGRLPAEEVPFDRLGHFQIVQRIGHGGMGDVYKGYDASLDRYVAIKVLPAALARDEDFVRRFHVEATAVAKLAHPNVVPIHFIGQDGGHHFFAMQFIEGESLSQRLARQRRLPVEQATPIVEQCLAGLEAAHAQGLVHRDVKPGNVLLDRRSGQAVLVDFGLVRQMGAAAQMTATGVVMGTVDYIAPEQARGQKVDGRSDIYSLGVMFYQLLAGRLPFTADTPTAMIFQHAYEEPFPLTKAAPDVPQPLVEIIARMMAKDPAERYDSCAAVLADLRAFREGRPVEDVGRIANPSGNDVGRIVNPSGNEADLLDGLPIRPTEESTRTLAPPLSPVPLPPDTPLQRAKDWAATIFRRHAPQALRELQSTTQQVDGAVAEHERRSKRLRGLLDEARGVVAELAAQIRATEQAAQDLDVQASKAANPEAIRDKVRACQEDLAALRVQQDEQQEQVGQWEAELSKAEATLVRLRSQRDVLKARMTAAEARQRAEGITPSRRARFRWDRKVSLVAAGSAAVILGALLLSLLGKSKIRDLKSEIPPPAVAPFDARKAREYQEAWAKHLGVPVEITNSIGMKLVLIPPGEFIMGSTKELIEEERSLHDRTINKQVPPSPYYDSWYKDHLPGEAPQHRVRMTKPFYLGVTQVTQEEYQRVMGNNPSKFQGGPNRPVEQVSWDDAVEFCWRLSELENGGKRYQLPTEAQWEYGCRAGSITRYWFGDDGSQLGDYAWYEANSESKTHPVGEKRSNTWGLCEYGNVWEWCQDWYDKDYYVTSPTDDPAGQVVGGSSRVRRGGSWRDPAWHVRSAYRIAGKPWDRRDDVGFRISLILPGTVAERAEMSRSADAAQHSGGSTANMPAPPVAPIDEGLTRALNDFSHWRIERGDWRNENGAIIGSGDSELSFNHPLPGNFVLELTMTVLKGMRPRIHFTGFCVGNEGYDKIVSIYSASGRATGRGFDYQNHQEMKLRVVAEGKDVKLFINGSLVSESSREKSEFSMLSIDGGDWWSQGTTSFSSFSLGLLPASAGSGHEISAAPGKQPPLAFVPFDGKKAKEQQEACAKHLGVPVEITNSIGMKLAIIPPGEFMMGSPKELIEEELKAHGDDQGHVDPGYKERLPGEGPQHRVRITKPFYLGTYLVTQGEYQRVMGANPSEFSATGKSKDKVAGQETKRFPVENVSWDDAVEFCRKLSEMPQEKAARRTYRLPSEAQWEYACRAGSTGRHSFSSGPAAVPKEYAERELADDGWFGGFGGGMPHAVGLKRASAWGLYDMHGNVWEWCQDWYDKEYYANAPTDDPDGPIGGSVRVVRGGCWGGIAGYCRSACRGYRGPGDPDDGLDFRVSLVLPDTAAQRATTSGAADATQPSAGTAAHEPPPAVVPFDEKKAKEHQELWAERLGVPVEISNSIGMKLALIPPGEFMMGTPKELIEEELKTHGDDQWYQARLPGEGPQHRVRITKVFCLGMYLVTQGEYQRVMGTNPSEFSATGKSKDKVAGQDTKRFPVENVSWDDAVGFCRKLSDLPEEKAVGRTYLLPSEAQWEYACRAGSTGRFGFSSVRSGIPKEYEERALSDYGWFRDNADGMPHAVGLKRASPWGLYDMQGNVWEWCRDWYDKDYYAKSPTDDPTGPPGGSIRVDRGGGWYHPARFCRSAGRNHYLPGPRAGDLGFRVSLVLADE
jgi:formylglycine-generating enzyme required for sulfatase activity/serine/threonine protein kinase